MWCLYFIPYFSTRASQIFFISLVNCLENRRTSVDLFLLLSLNRNHIKFPSKLSSHIKIFKVLYLLAWNFTVHDDDILDKKKISYYVVNFFYHPVKLLTVEKEIYNLCNIIKLLQLWKLCKTHFITQISLFGIKFSRGESKIGKWHFELFWEALKNMRKQHELS